MSLALFTTQRNGHSALAAKARARHAARRDADEAASEAARARDTIARLEGELSRAETLNTQHAREHETTVARLQARGDSSSRCKNVCARARCLPKPAE